MWCCRSGGRALVEMGRGAAVGARGGPCVAAPARLQSNFPMSSDLHVEWMNPDYWLLYRGKWSLYCFSKTNVSCGPRWILFPGPEADDPQHTRTPSPQKKHPFPLFTFITHQSAPLPLPSPLHARNPPPPGSSSHPSRWQSQLQPPRSHQLKGCRAITKVLRSSLSVSFILWTVKCDTSWHTRHV